MSISRTLLASAVVATLLTGLGAGQAQAANAWLDVAGPRTVLSFSGTDGDPVAQGRSLTYRPRDARFRARALPGGAVNILVGDADRQWSLDLAPPAGQQLAPGTYTDVEDYPWQDPARAGFNFSGDGNACGPVIATFTVRRVSIQPGGWIRNLDAEFRQSCEWAPEESVTGRIVLDNLPDPGPVTADIRPGRVQSLRPDGTVVVTGTIRCNQPVELNLTVSLWQEQPGADPVNANATSDWFVCGTLARTWTATTTNSSGRSLQPGAADVSVYLSQHDAQHDTWVSGQADREVRLVNRAG